MQPDELAALTEVLRVGVPIVLLDDLAREGEADLLLHARHMAPEHVRLLRKEAGGLLCLATDERTARTLGLPFMADLLRESRHATLRKIALERSPYGDPPAFSVWINHRQTFTGITDEDRSMTLRKFEEMVSGNGKNGSRGNGNAQKPGPFGGALGGPHPMAARFISEFYSPGHVPLLVGRGLERRKGHTELALALAKKAGMSPAMAMCEMLGDNGRALSWNQARAKAQEKGWIVAEGPQLLNALRDEKK